MFFQRIAQYKSWNETESSTFWILTLHKQSKTSFIPNDLPEGGNKFSNFLIPYS